MNIKEVKELIELIDSSEIAYLELEIDNAHIKLDKSLTRGNANLVEQKSAVNVDNTSQKIVESIKNKEKIEEVSEEVSTDNGDYMLIKSPMVGTFYSSPSPDSSKFVAVGDEVKSGDVLCIIEAMKLMNEIESEINGKLVEVLIKDGDMVEYGTPLFKLKEM
ncbi:acetyl-CoA carboxylase biotin carboxyl carrier protein [uncultured Clostridium sp.]|uniref:acetyl-CoA carboxylase biotin carboxyl carrier protein n=1 Tax=uncultured Clostridium sp. TaxID=59620 RepID=UPI00262275AC|nr:acetyl-CoA carboxylase biotin carboxyl carrier protein [uncultured Clostridium sp.]